MQKLKLSTSNPKKLQEFKRILGDQLEIVKGEDLKEVKGTSKEVILYKALAAPDNTIIEDTILTIDSEEVVDIKWKIEELKTYKKQVKGTWQVSLGVKKDNQVFIYIGQIHGKIIPNSNDKGYGFDPYFQPDGTNETLAKLESKGLKDFYSARKIALLNLIHNTPYEIVDIKNIPEWTGEYQNENI